MDVAAACVNALYAPDAADATFEVYEIRRRVRIFGGGCLVM